MSKPPVARGPSVCAVSQCERVASDLRNCVLIAEHLDLGTA
jgi:hypothetical protein